MSTRLIVPTSAVTIAGDVVVPVRGDVTLDETTTYGQARLSLPLVDIGDVEAIDPRDGQRVLIEAQIAGAPARMFDLGLRGSRVNHADKTIDIVGATDEAMLADYAPLADDLAPLALRGSLRSVINYVLNKVIPGAALEATPSNDARVTMLDVDNLVDNPMVAVDATDWGAHTAGAAGSGARVVGTAPDGNTFFRVTFTASPPEARVGAFYFIPQNSMKPGMHYAASATVRTSVARPVRIGVEWRDEADSTISISYGPTATTVANVWRELTFPNAIAPAGTQRAVVTVYGDPAGALWPAGSRLDATSLRVGPAASEPLNWRAGLDGWEFLLNLTAAKGLRLFCDELRDWRLVPTDYMVPGVVSVTAATATEGDDSIDRDGDLWADGVVVRYRWQQDDGAVLEATDTAGLPGKVELVEFERPYPGPGAAAFRLNRLKGQGRTQTATAFTDYRATPSMEARFSLPGTDDQIGRLQSVTFDLASGMMEPQARGLTDVPETAYIFGDPGISYEDVPVGISYEEFEWSMV